MRLLIEFIRSEEFDNLVDRLIVEQNSGKNRLLRIEILRGQFLNGEIG